MSTAEPLKFDRDFQKKRGGGGYGNPVGSGPGDYCRGRKLPQPVLQRMIEPGWREGLEELLCPMGSGGVSLYELTPLDEIILNSTQEAYNQAPSIDLDFLIQPSRRYGLDYLSEDLLLFSQKINFCWYKVRYSKTSLGARVLRPKNV